VAVTNAPAVINLYEDVEFVFNTKYDFKNRFSGEPDYFSNKGEQKGLLLETNFVADASICRSSPRRSAVPAGAISASTWRADR